MSSAEYQAPCRDDSQRSSSANSQAFAAAEGDHRSGHWRKVLGPEEQVAQPAVQVVRPMLPREKIKDQGSSGESAHAQTRSYSQSFPSNHWASLDIAGKAICGSIEKKKTLRK